MKRFTLIFVVMVVFCSMTLEQADARFFYGNYLRRTSRQSAINAYKQVKWDEIAGIAEYGHGPTTTNGQGGYYKDTAITQPASNGDEVKGLRAFGTNKPSPANLQYKGNTALTPTNAVAWWKDNGSPSATSLAPTYYDRGNWDKYLRLLNGPINTSYYETDPGSFTAKTNPMDFILAFRYLPQIKDEGTNTVKEVGGTHVEAISGYSPTIILSNGNDFIPYIDNVLRIYIDASGNWEVWINGVSKGTGTGVAFSTTEWIWGSSSHVLTSHIRYNIVKFGKFTDAEIATIYANTKIIWPWTKPSYPFITELWQGGGNIWDGAAKSWTYGRTLTPVFSGGTGTAGTHKYVWYYFDNNDATLFPSPDGILTNHRQVPASVNVSTIASGNSVTQITMDGVNLMSAPVSYTTSATVTADAIVTNINANQTAYLAQRRSTATILFHPNGLGSNTYHINHVIITASGFTPTSIDAPRGQSLVRTTYAVPGQIWDGIGGNDTTYVMCVTYPYDSNGIAGDPIPSEYTRDNIP